MAGIAGVFMRRGQPADAAQVSRMAAAAARRSPDGSWAWQDGPFAAIRQRTICTLEDAWERDAVVSDAAGAALVFDGRLDNRGELAALLGIPTAQLRTLPDASLALAAWLRWREATPVHLLGDFAFVTWDRGAREVFCATDPFGVRPLHYFVSERALVFATEVAQLLSHPLVEREPDEGGIAELLSGDPRTPGRTLYKNISRLPHARSLTVSGDQTRLTRYWRPQQQVIIRRHDSEYEEAFRDEFDRAVAVRLRSSVPVGAQLSGGLDSSSVVATARLLAPNRSLTACSILFPPGTDADERAYINAVLAHLDVPALQVHAPPFSVDEAREQVHRRQYLPDYPHTLIASALRREMASRGMRVSLTGSGGDLGLCGSFFHYADLLRHGRLVAFARRYANVARSPEHGWTNAEVVRGGVWPFLPAGVRRFLRPVARRCVGLAVPEWIEPDFASRAGLAEPAPGASASACGTLASATTAAAYDGGLVHLVHDLYELGASEYGIYDRHPFLDRRLIELLVSLPDEQRWNGGQMKRVLRRAIGPRLPDVVRQRSDHAKSDFSHLNAEALAGLGGESFFEGLWIERRGWVKRGALPSLFHRMQRLRNRGNLRHRDLGWQLWSAAAVELWYGGVFEAAASPRHSWHTHPQVETTTANARTAGRLKRPIASPN